jgi:hypothetical protein
MQAIMKIKVMKEVKAPDKPAPSPPLTIPLLSG